MKKIKNILNTNFLFILIIFLSLVVRFYALDKIPASLNPDEAALGYTAYSILHTGTDEHGKFLPLALESFGDWKLPIYSYLSIIPILVMDLSVFSTRFISALSGVFAVILIFFISKKLFKNINVALISSLFLAISPWSIYFSRAAYEVNLATTFFIAGFLFILNYIEFNKIRWLFLSLIFLILTLFTYSSYVIFTPLFLIGLLIIKRKEIKLNKIFITLLIVFFGFVLFSIFSSIYQSTNKTTTLLVFTDPNTIYERVNKIRGDGATNNPLEKIIYNKFIGGAYQFGQNYLSAFSPSFLFDKGGEKLVDNLGYFGNLYLIDALLIILGFGFLLTRKEISFKYLLLWLILAPIPTALTKNPLSSTRLFILMPIFALISSYGFYQLFKFLDKKSFINFLLKIIIIVLFAYNITLFIFGYYIHMNVQRAIFWKYGYEQAAMLSKKFPDYKVVTKGMNGVANNFPYIYYLFYNKYPPAQFIREVKYYPADSEGYAYVKSFGRFNFPEDIEYNNLQPRTIYIDDNYFRFTNKILLPSGEPVLSYEVVK